LRRWGTLAAIGIAALLAACATTPKAPRFAFADLPGWGAENHLAALDAVRAACRTRRDPTLSNACSRLAAAPPGDDVAARRFLEASFEVQPLDGQGLLTAYFAPQYEARAAAEPPFTAPVRPAPPQALVPGGPVPPLPERAAIEAEPVDGALAWMKPEDLFYLQLQGSGVLLLPDGGRLKAAFAGSNGQPFVGIARVMRERGLIDDAHSSGDQIRAWLAAHRGPEADAVMDQNPRYAFFSVRPDDGVQPVGAAGVPLPPGRALAVDPGLHRLGELYWIDASAPALAGAFPSYRRLAAALDTGAAIRGEVRADLYMGLGDAAGFEAGRVRHVLKMYRLVPR
jgi:membrane-bound lytic murein transglycosylase A